MQDIMKRDGVRRQGSMERPVAGARLLVTREGGREHAGHYGEGWR